MARKKTRALVEIVDGHLTRRSRRSLRPARLEFEIARHQMMVIAYETDHRALLEETHANAFLMRTDREILDSAEKWRLARTALEVLQAEQKRRTESARTMIVVDEWTEVKHADFSSIEARVARWAKTPSG